MTHAHTSIAMTRKNCCYHPPPQPPLGLTARNPTVTLDHMLRLQGLRCGHPSELHGIQIIVEDDAAVSAP